MCLYPFSDQTKNNEILLHFYLLLFGVDYPFIRTQISCVYGKENICYNQKGIDGIPQIV